MIWSQARNIRVNTNLSLSNGYEILYSLSYFWHKYNIIAPLSNTRFASFSSYRPVRSIMAGMRPLAGFRQRMLKSGWGGKTNDWFSETNLFFAGFWKCLCGLSHILGRALRAWWMLFGRWACRLCKGWWSYFMFSFLDYLTYEMLVSGGSIVDSEINI